MIISSGTRCCRARPHVGDLQPAPARMEGQLDKRRFPQLLLELVDRRRDHGYGELACMCSGCSSRARPIDENGAITPGLPG